MHERYHDSGVRGGFECEGGDPHHTHVVYRCPEYVVHSRRLNFSSPSQRMYRYMPKVHIHIKCGQRFRFVGLGRGSRAKSFLYRNYSHLEQYIELSEEFWRCNLLSRQ